LVMRSRLVLAVYGVAALWLAVFVAYLVYLLLPFGVGVFSGVVAGLVALWLFAWLVRSLVWRPRRIGAVGQRRLAMALTLAAATLAFDAGWTEYLVSFPPTNQDDCRFGPIGPEEFRALKREMATKLEPDWLAFYSDTVQADEKLERQMAALLPQEATEPEMIAHIHALARSFGAQYTGGGHYYRGPSDNDLRFSTAYSYRFDLNRIFGVRGVFFRWARVLFRVDKSELDSERTHLQYAAVVMPSITQNSLLPDEAESSCPRPAGPIATLTEQDATVPERRGRAKARRFRLRMRRVAESKRT
jgi:hypothetical protein